MKAVFTYALKKFRGQILGWGVSLGLLSAYIVPLYDTVSAQREQFTQLLKSYPKELFAFFGGEVNSFLTPKGYLNTEFFSFMPLIIGIFAILAGSGLLAGDEEAGVLDLILAHPVSRTKLFVGRFLAFILSLLITLGIIWTGFVLMMQRSTTLNFPWDKMILPFLSLFSILVFFGTLALLLSMLLPSRRFASMTSGIILVASFFISSLVRLDQNLETLAKFSPLNYYQGGEAISGLNWGWVFGLLAVSLIFVVLAWWRFKKRDIRTAGEGSLRAPLLSRLIHRSKSTA